MNNIFLFHGDDTFSSTEKINIWKSEFIKKFGDINFEQIEGKKLIPNEFLTNLESQPFLSEKRLIIVNNFLDKGKKEDQEKVAQAIEKTPEFSIIVFQETKSPDKRTKLFKTLKKAAKIEEFKILEPGQITTWILNKAKQKEIQINFSTANFLSQYCENNLWTISNELEKLNSYANKSEITQEMIEKLATPSLSTSIFKLTDSISIKDRKTAINALKTLRESGEEIGKIFHMIIRHFRILLQVKELTTQSKKEPEIAKALGQHPFVIKKTSHQSKNFTTAQLKSIYRQLLKIDIKTKTGIIKTSTSSTREFELALEKLILKI